MIITITLTAAGADTGPFDLYSDVDGYTTAFDTGVAKNDLLAGYSTTAPDGTSTVKVLSTGICTNYIYLTVIPYTTTTTSTTTNTSTTTSTSTSTSTTTTTSTTSVLLLGICVNITIPTEEVENGGEQLYVIYYPAFGDGYIDLIWNQTSYFLNGDSKYEFNICKKEGTIITFKYGEGGSPVLISDTQIENGECYSNEDCNNVD